MVYAGASVNELEKLQKELADKMKEFDDNWKMKEAMHQKLINEDIELSLQEKEADIKFRKECLLKKLERDNGGD